MVPPSPNLSFRSISTSPADSTISNASAAPGPLKTSSHGTLVSCLSPQQNAIREKRNALALTLAKDETFQARKAASFIYAVRAIAIPYDPTSANVNGFTGPRIADRNATILGQGGWVVPPLAERLAHRKDKHRRLGYRPKHQGNYPGLPKPQVTRAMPIRLDSSFAGEPRTYGEAPPVWRELVDPCLEDVYCMAWQLIAGKQFVGFLGGTGFGIARIGEEGVEDMLAEARFVSPCREAIFHSANFEEEQKKV
jgi:hypothetical protein